MAVLEKLGKLWRLIRISSYRRALRYGTAAAVEHDLLIAGLQIGTLIDVGANKGQFSLLVREHHTAAAIYAVEPLAESGDIYSAHFASDDKVTLLRCAAGSRQDSQTINISGRADSSSMLPITAAQESAFPGTAQTGTRTVPVEPLDSLIDAGAVASPLLIKLDIQGYELEALKGMPRLMAKADYIYMELSFTALYADQPLASDVVSWLSVRGFDLAIVNGVTRSRAGIPVQADVLFMRRAVRGL